MNSTLNAKQQAVVPIAAFTASGNIDKLQPALYAGLEAGLSVNEIKEILVQMYAYAGFPRSLNGLETFMTVLKERAAKGLEDEIGRESSPPPKDKTILESGTAVQTQLAGEPVRGPLFEFAPVIDEYLKTHLFGDIFTRDVLDFQQREIATIAALSSLEGVENQLRAHFRIGRNVGLTLAQLEDLTSVLETKVGRIESEKAATAFARTFQGGDKKIEPKIMIAELGTQAPVKGPSQYFTGTVRIDPQFAARDQSRSSAGIVTFEPGARTAWHTHPVGQALIVTSGLGRVRQWGGEIRDIRAGDVVWFPAGIKHWHGASPTTPMTHIAIQEEINGSAVKWMEHVTEEQYSGETPEK